MSAPNGVVAAGDPQTAQAGAATLEAGGNAVDSVCAAAFAAFVVEPPLCSPAGAGALLCGGRDEAFAVLDFFAQAPGLGTSPTTELDFRSVQVDFGPTTQEFHIGRGAAAVPGAAQGLLEAHGRYGRLPLSEVLAPAVALARGGYTLSAPVQFIVSILEPILTHTAGVRAIFGAHDGLPRAGARLDNPPLGDFLEALGAEGPALLSGPFRAALLAGFGASAGGLLTAEDLERYTPTWRTPLAVQAAGHTVLTNPPPSSGGALVALGLKAGAEPLRRAGSFLDPAHAAELAALLGGVAAFREEGYDRWVRDADALERLMDPETLAAIEHHHRAAATERALGSTTHISVLDGRGGAASLTMSNGEGCGFAVDAFGIHVNNFLGEEDINPKGFHQWAAGERMTTMMAPTVVLQDGRPRVVLGSGGSNRIRSAILHVLLAELIHGLPLQDAVDSPRMHVEGAKLWFEAPGLPTATIDALVAAWPGATRFDQRSMFFGGVHAVADEHGGLHGAGDPRRGGAVAFAKSG